MATNETAETQAAGSSSQQATTLSPTSLLSQLRSPTQSELTRKRKVRVLTNRPTPAREKRSQLAQFNEHNLSIIGTFIEHNRYMYIFGAVQHRIIGRFWSIIGSGLSPVDNQPANLCRGQGTLGSVDINNHDKPKNNTSELITAAKK